MKVLAETKEAITLVNSCGECLDNVRPHLVNYGLDVQRWESRDLIKIFGFVKDDRVKDVDFELFIKEKGKGKEVEFVALCNKEDKATQPAPEPAQAPVQAQTRKSYKTKGRQ